MRTNALIAPSPQKNIDQHPIAALSGMQKLSFVDVANVSKASLRVILYDSSLQRCGILSVTGGCTASDINKQSRPNYYDKQRGRPACV